MKNINFKELAHNLMFEINDEQEIEISKEFEILTKQLSLLSKIDTTNVEEMIYPFEDETFFMRDDDETYVLETQQVLKNVKKHKQGHFVVPKVVK